MWPVRSDGGPEEQGRTKAVIKKRIRLNLWQRWIGAIGDSKILFGEWKISSHRLLTKQRRILVDHSGASAQS